MTDPFRLVGIRSDGDGNAELARAYSSIRRFGNISAHGIPSPDAFSSMATPCLCRAGERRSSSSRHIVLRPVAEPLDRRRYVR